MPAVPLSIIGPIWEQFADLLPERKEIHPLGCHHPRIPDQVVFEKLVEVLVFGCAYERIADRRVRLPPCGGVATSGSTPELWRRLREMVLEAYDRMIGLDLSDVAVDGCITKAPCGGQKAGKSPVDRGNRASNAQWSWMLTASQ